jgi:hypothetical protein
LLTPEITAAAANNGQRQRGFTGIIIEWIATAVLLPLQALSAIASLPFKTIIALINFGKTSVASPQPTDKGRKSMNGKYPSHGRFGDRAQSRVGKR